MISRRRLHLAGLTLVVVLAAAPSGAQEECVQLPPGAVAWWPADGTLEDVVGGHDAQDLGWAFPVVFSPGRVGQAFDFDAFDTALVVQHDDALNFGPGDEYTLALWMRTRRVLNTAAAVLVSKWQGFSQPFPYEVRISATTGADNLGRVAGVCFDETSSAAAQTTQALDDETFHHLALVFRHPDLTIDNHVDGTLESSTTYPAPLGSLANPSDLHFGIRANPINPYSATNYRGLLDEIMIFDRALSACEIDAIHAAGEAGVCRGDSDSDGYADYEDNCPQDPNDPQTDTDGDGVGDECDCARLNPSHSVVPPEVCSLTLSRNGDVETLDWTSLTEISGSGTRYDVLRGYLDELPVGTGASELCVADDLDTPSFEDPFEPAPSEGVWYLVRAVSQCGQGSWGFTSSDVQRISPACP